MVILQGIAALCMNRVFVSSGLIPGIWGSTVSMLLAQELGSSLICRGVQVVKTAPVLTSAGPQRTGEILSSGHKRSTGYTKVSLFMIKNLTIFHRILQEYKARMGCFILLEHGFLTMLSS